MANTQDQYLVVGNPVAHSRSPEIHRAFAAQFADSMQYGKAEIELGHFASFVDEFAASGGRGLNVTVPFKLDAFAYVDECDPLALAAGAVNTIVLARDEPSRGFNTDGVGLVNDLTQRHQIDLRNKVVLILGAGGATQGVVEPLLQADVGRLIVANRTRDKAEGLVERYLSRNKRAPLQTMALADIDDQAATLSPPDIVINATSIGLAKPTTDPADEFDLISPRTVQGKFCYDMSYGAAAHFCVWADRHGAARSVDGLGMLVEQAAVSYQLWRGKLPATEPVVQQLRQVLHQSTNDSSPS